jgi:hypothetical protein
MARKTAKTTSFCGMFLSLAPLTRRLIVLPALWLRMLRHWAVVSRPAAVISKKSSLCIRFRKLFSTMAAVLFVRAGKPTSSSSSSGSCGAPHCSIAFLVLLCQPTHLSRYD